VLLRKILTLLVTKISFFGDPEVSRFFFISSYLSIQTDLSAREDDILNIQDALENRLTRYNAESGLWNSKIDKKRSNYGELVIALHFFL